MTNERTPLLSRGEHVGALDDADDPHTQFCKLSGIPPSNLPLGTKIPRPGRQTLFGRASSQYSSSKTSYNVMAFLSNFLLLSQVMLGAALTALGASESSHILITVFGATNTVIAGLVAYLKSRGQPMRSRMYRDDLERVVDEMENSEIMWLGISEGINGYDQIDIDSKVTVRAEIARLTRLYQQAMRNNSLNNPDNYLMGTGSDGGGAALRTRPVVQHPDGPVVPVPGPGNPTPAPALDPDESPLTAVAIPLKATAAGPANAAIGDAVKNGKDPAKDPSQDNKDAAKGILTDSAKPEASATPSGTKTGLGEDAKSTPNSSSTADPKLKDEAKKPEGASTAEGSIQNGPKQASGKNTTSTL